MKAIDVDTTMYVDSAKGNNSNDGLSWATAKKTIGGLPKEINAHLTIMYRRKEDEHVTLSDFCGEGTVSFHDAFIPDMEVYLRLLSKQYIWRECDNELL